MDNAHSQGLINTSDPAAKIIGLTTGVKYVVADVTDATSIKWHGVTTVSSVGTAGTAQTTLGAAVADSTGALTVDSISDGVDHGHVYHVYMLLEPTSGSMLSALSANRKDAVWDISTITTGTSVTYTPVSGDNGTVLLYSSIINTSTTPSYRPDVNADAVNQTSPGTNIFGNSSTGGTNRTYGVTCATGANGATFTWDDANLNWATLDMTSLTQIYMITITCATPV